MDSGQVKRGPGRPKGSKQGRWTVGQLREAMGKAHTTAEWASMFRALPPLEKWRLRVAVEPKAVDFGSTGPSIQLIIGGISQTKPIDGGEVICGEVLPAIEAPRALPSASGPAGELVPPARRERCGACEVHAGSAYRAPSTYRPDFQDSPRSGRGVRSRRMARAAAYA